MRELIQAINQAIFQSHPHLISTFILLKEGYTMKEIAGFLSLKQSEIKDRMNQIANVAIEVKEA